MCFRTWPDPRAFSHCLKVCWASDARGERPLAASCKCPRGFPSSHFDLSLGHCGPSAAEIAQKGRQSHLRNQNPWKILWNPCKGLTVKEIPKQIPQNF